MGRHLSGDAGADDETDVAALDAEVRETARHVASGSAQGQDQLLEPQAVISPDTHVGVDFDQLAPGTPDAAASPAHPDALVEHGTVGDGHEME